MNAPPINTQYPKVIEGVLEHGIIKCIAFNRRGTLLAAGCANGSVVIWDFGYVVRSISKVLTDKDASAPITSVCWSKNGHRILVSAADKSLTLWGVVSGEKISHITLPHAPIKAHLHPGSSTPFICLACSFASPPMIVDMNTRSISDLPVLVPDEDQEISLFPPTASCFNKYGDLVYMGSSEGELLITDHQSLRVRAVNTIPGNGIKNIVFSRNGKYLLINSNDRIIRIYGNLLPLKDQLKALDDLHKVGYLLYGTNKLKVIGSDCLALLQVCQESITKHLKALCFSGDGEWVVGGSASKEHKMYLWDRAGRLVKTLEGPKEALIDLAWHPVRHTVVSVSSMGLAYIWSKEYTLNWGPFSPGLKEIKENEEGEDEFDLVPEAEAGKTSVRGDEEVDIWTREIDSAFSDLDMSQEELIFLPYIPFPDAPQQDGQEMNHVPSPLEATDNSVAEDGEGHGNKKHRLSAKGL